MLKIGVIGYGKRMNDVIKALMLTGEVRLAAITDINISEVKKQYIDKNGYEGVNYYDSADDMFIKEKLDGVCIGTRCSTHTEYAVLAAKYNIPIFLEKPVATTYEDLDRLKGILNMNDKIVVSFPLRLSRMVTYVKELTDSGKIGKIEHIQAYNNVPYGRGYYHKWYRDESETGGLFLQKATHDLDYINYLLDGQKPVCVCAMKSKQIFKGNKPAGMMCKNCADVKICPESPENVRKNNDGYIIGDYCCFAEDTGNEDSGSVIVEYDSGMHAVYSQNFAVRNGAGKRGARLIGYYGTAEFDWYTGVVTVYHHMENVVETHKFTNPNQGHFGGDELLAENFVNVMKGTEKSRATLKEGIVSAEMCLAARKSSTEHKFVNVNAL